MYYSADMRPYIARNCAPSFFSLYQPGRLDLDLIFSLCALFISAIAAGASLYQLNMASSSIAAQTWPYVTIGWNYANEQSGIVVANDGLGPALIRDTVLKVDGHPQPDVLEALSKLIDISHGPKGTIELDALIPGVVIRAGQSFRLFSIGGARWDSQLRDAQSRVELEVCYCSVLDRCWISSTQSSAQSVARCLQHNPSSLSLPKPKSAFPPIS
jgi:hypothetical protein